LGASTLVPPSWRLALAPQERLRGLYSSILERWLGLDAKPIVNGTFEQLTFV
jgi:uncharacterized protein (DUF1501 family)